MPERHLALGHLQGGWPGLFDRRAHHLEEFTRESVTTGEVQVERNGLPAGARRVGEIYHGTAGSFQVMLDPEGNEWCLVSPVFLRKRMRTSPCA